MAKHLSKCYQPSNIKLIFKDIMCVTKDHNIQRNLSMIINEEYIFLIVILRWWCKNIHNSTVEHIVVWKNVPFPVLQLLDCQGHLDDGSNNTITEKFMFDGSSNVKLSGELMNLHSQQLNVMRGFEHTFYICFNDVSK